MGDPAKIQDNQEFLAQLQDASKNLVDKLQSDNLEDASLTLMLQRTLPRLKTRRSATPQID